MITGSDKPGLQITVTEDEMAKAGWRCCQDHLLKPSMPCPICMIEKMQKQIVELEHELNDARSGRLPT